MVGNASNIEKYMFYSLDASPLTGDEAEWSARLSASRLQFGCHGGSNVFFNRNGEDCRYSLIDGIGVRLENGKYPTLRAYPNRILFQTMMPQAKCNMAS